MFTLCIRYTLNPNKLRDFQRYAEAEQEPIRRSGGENIEYFVPTDFAGANTQAIGLVDFKSIADYERYRYALADDPEHKTNAARLTESGVIVSLERSIIQRVPSGTAPKSQDN
jgi:hypothetical protein